MSFQSTAREPISFVISFDQLRKRREKMKDVNVSHGETKMDKLVSRRESYLVFVD
jgi:hypothetical protein